MRNTLLSNIIEQVNLEIRSGRSADDAINIIILRFGLSTEGSATRLLRKHFKVGKEKLT